MAQDVRWLPLILSCVICFVVSPYSTVTGSVSERLRAGWILCNSGGIAFTAVQIYLKFGTEPALSAGKPHCGWATQAAGMTALRRRHVLRSESINKRVTENVFSTQKYRQVFNETIAFCIASLSASLVRARAYFFLLKARIIILLLY